MLTELLEREVTKRSDTVRLQGRILFLTEDPELIRRQLQGEDLDWDPSIPLRDDISTDEITPGWVCWDDKGCGVCRPAARHSRLLTLKHILIGFRLVRE
ncbi:MAG: hypothetical protein V3W24_05895 [Gemmatimonadota bacterium]